MRVLNVVTWEEARFFREQVHILEKLGVESSTLSVEAKTIRKIAPKIGGEAKEARSISDYARLYPDILTHAFDDYDLIHANYGLTAPLALAQPTLPVVLSLWGSDLLGKYGYVSKICARFVNAVIVMSAEMATVLDMECYIIPHGVDTEKFKPIPQSQAQSELKWDTDRYHVLFPYPEDRSIKNYPLAKETVMTAAERLDEPIQLHTTTGIPHRDMATFMNAADVLLLTSEREGSPNTVKEAIACNLPVVSRNVGDVRERISEVTPSLVCETDDELVDGLIAVLTDGRRSNGSEAVGDITLEKMGRDMKSVYETVVSNRTNSSASFVQGATR